MAEIISLDTIKEIMVEARKGVNDLIVRLTVENDTLKAQNESLRKRLENDENKRLRAKLDRATRRIASMVRERETMLTQERAAILREVAKANVKIADHRADVVAEELHRVLMRERIANAEHARLLAAALQERDEWRAKADAAPRTDIGAWARLLGEIDQLKRERDEWRAKAEAPHEVSDKQTAGLMQALYAEACARENAEKERDGWKAKAEAPPRSTTTMPGQYRISVGGGSGSTVALAAGDHVSFTKVSE